MIEVEFSSYIFIIRKKLNLFSKKIMHMKKLNIYTWNLYNSVFRSSFQQNFDLFFLIF